MMKKDINKNLVKVHFFTIGHSNQKLDDFMELLTKFGIDCLIDIRSIPKSYNKDFDKNALQNALGKRNIKYFWLGNELGGLRPKLENSAGQRIYESFYKDKTFEMGINRLIEIAKTHKTALMCSEEDPANCHRHKLIANSLLNKKIEGIENYDFKIDHIRANGETEDARTVPFLIQMSFSI